MAIRTKIEYLIIACNVIEDYFSINKSIQDKNKNFKTIKCVCR